MQNRPNLIAHENPLRTKHRGQPTGHRPRAHRLLAAVGVGGLLLAGGILAASPASAAASDVGVLGRIKACESGGSYTAVNPSSGASGAYQFLDSTWRSLPAASGYHSAAAAPAPVQDRAARQLFAQQGTAPWLASASCWQHGGASPTRSVSYRRAWSRTASHHVSAYHARDGAVRKHWGEDSGDRASTTLHRRDAEHSDQQREQEGQH